MFLLTNYTGLFTHYNYTSAVRYSNKSPLIARIKLISLILTRPIHPSPLLAWP